MPKVSVIIPVYNGAEYLRKNVAGLLKQTLEDIELIFVNDASTDDTWNVLRAINYMNPGKYKIIDSDRNRGPGGARNIGIAAAGGEYIGFTDCDDDPAPTMFERLYAEAKAGDHDIVSCSFLDVRRNKINVYAGNDFNGRGDNIRRSLWIARGGYVYTNIYRRKMFNSERARFRENVTLEDADFLTYMFAVSNSFGSIRDALYKYNAPENSTSQIEDMRRYSKYIMAAMQALYDKTGDLPYYHDIQRSVEYFTVFLYHNCVKRCLAMLNTGLSKDSKSKVRKIIEKLVSCKKNLVVYENNKNNYCLTNFKPGELKLLDILEEKGVKQCFNYARENPHLIEF